MKRSINSENFVVVIVVAIALSLLATACGPGKMKTKLSTAGVSLKQSDNGEFTFTADDIASAEEDQNLATLAVDSIVASDDQASSTTSNDEDSQSTTTSVAAATSSAQSDIIPEEIAASQTLANKIRHIRLIERIDGKKDYALDVRFKDYNLAYVNGVEDSVTKKLVFPTAAVIDARESRNEKLPTYTAELEVLTSHLRDVHVIEKDQKTNKQSIAKAAVRTGIVSAQIISEDENVSKLKDKKFAIKGSQFYTGKLPHVNYVKSPANKVNIIVLNTLAFYTHIDNENRNPRLNIVALNDEAKKLGINNENYEASLVLRNDSFITKQVDLKLVNRTTGAESRINLIAEESSTNRANDQTAESSDNATQSDQANSAQQNNSAQNEAFEVLPKPDFSNVVSGATSKPDFSNVVSGATSMKAVPAPSETSAVTTPLTAEEMRKQFRRSIK